MNNSPFLHLSLSGMLQEFRPIILKGPQSKQINKSISLLLNQAPTPGITRLNPTLSGEPNSGLPSARSHKSIPIWAAVFNPLLPDSEVVPLTGHWFRNTHLSDSGHFSSWDGSGMGYRSMAWRSGAKSSERINAPALG